MNLTDLHYNMLLCVYMNFIKIVFSNIRDVMLHIERFCYGNNFVISITSSYKITGNCDQTLMNFTFKKK